MDNLNQTQSISVNIIIGFIFFVPGIILSLVNLRAVILAKSSLNWEQTRGKILNSELVATSMSDRSGRTYKASVSYQYSLENHSYTSDRVYFGNSIASSFKRKDSQETVRKYGKDKEVMVYYNPSNEKMSVLEPGLNWEVIAALIFGIVFTLVGYVMLWHPGLIKVIQ